MLERTTHAIERTDNTVSSVLEAGLHRLGSVLGRALEVGRPLDQREHLVVDMQIRRNSRQRMVIASGVEAYPNIAQTAYQAVRPLTGDIRPKQFMTGPGEEDGFFDALGNGPISATDPRALGGDLVDVSVGNEP